MMPFVLFLSGWNPGSAQAQLVEQDVFTTASYDRRMYVRALADPDLLVGPYTNQLPFRMESGLVGLLQ